MHHLGPHPHLQKKRLSGFWKLTTLCELRRWCCYPHWRIQPTLKFGEFPRVAGWCLHQVWRWWFRHFWGSYPWIRLLRLSCQLVYKMDYTPSTSTPCFCLGACTSAYFQKFRCFDAVSPKLQQHQLLSRWHSWRCPFEFGLLYQMRQYPLIRSPSSTPGWIYYQSHHYVFHLGRSNQINYWPILLSFQFHFVWNHIPIPIVRFASSSQLLVSALSFL